MKGRREDMKKRILKNFGKKKIFLSFAKITSEILL